MTQIENVLAPHFGAVANSFCPLPDPNVAHWSRDHTRAAAALEFGLVSGTPFSVLTGPAGCGKTALVLHLMENIAEGMRVAKVDVGKDDAGVFAWLLPALDLPVPDQGGHAAALASLQQMLIGEYAQGRSTVLLIDEAHNLSQADLQSLALLSNINTARDRLLQIVLSGLPELRNRLTAPGVEDLAQRVGVWASVEPLAAEGTADYVMDRLRAAEADPELFAPEALALIHEVSGGVPRQINKLCELALIFAAAERSERIGADAVENVLSQGFFLPTADATRLEDARPTRLVLAAESRA